MNIKICGLSTPEAVAAVIANKHRGASHAGFIFFAKSPRNVSAEIAAPLAAMATSAGIVPVAVTVDADDMMLDHIVRVMAPAMLQLHGRETPERVAGLKARHGLQVIKALAVSTVEDLAKADAYRGIADRFLFDAKPPKGSELPGGNAVSFDWAILRQLPAGTDYFLAGGLDAHNVGDAIRIANPPGLDISSGVESAPGIKDVAMIDAFFEAVGG
jgi:phosphoribosylanthranilate isomerase